MKTLIIAVAALSVLGGAAASAQPYGRDQSRGQDRQDAPRVDNRQDSGRRDNGPAYGRQDNRQPDSRHDNGLHRGWAKGDRLPRTYWTRQYEVSDWRARHLRQPPRGYQWRRVNNDYVLAAVTTGLIASIVAGR